MKNDFKNKKVLILGLGINQGGLGATKFFAKAGAKVKVTDLKTAPELQASLDDLKEFPEIEYTLGEHKYEDLDWADLIIKNPALKPDNPYLIYAREKGKQVEIDMGIFLQFVKSKQIIGVTGTKGKSTTASLIYEVLNSHLRGVLFAGNIGKSVLDTIPYVKKDTLAVLEISSFQLEGFEDHQVSPKYAVITNIYPDHLNYYGSMEKYTESKKIIAKFQNPEDFLFIRKDDEVTSKPEFLKDLKGKIIYFSKEDLPENFSPKLPGEHNLENFAAAFAVTNKILRTQAFGSEAIAQARRGDALCAYKALENFAGVEFRLQLIYDKNDIKIYNDSAATNPDATIQALKALPNSILIAGGVNKNLPYKKMAEIINKYAKKVYFLEGTATDELKNLCKDLCKGRPCQAWQGEALQKQQTYNDLEKILQDIKKVAKPSDVILFSPGAASFNLFQNEFDRGRKFNEAVEKNFK